MFVRLASCFEQVKSRREIQKSIFEVGGAFFNPAKKIIRIHEILNDTGEILVNFSREPCWDLADPVFPAADHM